MYPDNHDGSKDLVINVVVIYDWVGTVFVPFSPPGQVTLIYHVSPLLPCQGRGLMKCFSPMSINLWARLSTRLATILISPINLSIRWEEPSHLQQRGFTTGCLDQLEKRSKGHTHCMQRRHPFILIKPGPRPTGRLIGRQTGGNAAMMTRLP